MNNLGTTCVFMTLVRVTALACAVGAQPQNVDIADMCFRGLPLAGRRTSPDG